MLVKERMSSNPITVTPDTSLNDALRIMREAKIRRLPVVNKNGRLVGIVLERDLLYASPSPATSLSVYELNYLVSKITVDELMSRELITVEDDCPLEDAARIMVDNNVGGLPVMRGDKLVGMITESDLFKIFLELLGARTAGLRVTIKVAEGHGVLARLTQDLSVHGADIVTLSTFAGDDATNREIVFKVQGVDAQFMQSVVQNLDAELVDVRAT
ncbi:MAG: CBS and ACT domain-containing protein [Anaerolineae bacterium]